jgi:hypothetical protein
MSFALSALLAWISNPSPVIFHVPVPPLLLEYSPLAPNVARVPPDQQIVLPRRSAVFAGRANAGISIDVANKPTMAREKILRMIISNKKA